MLLCFCWSLLTRNERFRHFIVCSSFFQIYKLSYSAGLDMDIGALLAKSNVEAAREEDYDADDFENEETETTNTQEIDKAAVLKAATAKVALEEKKIADRILYAVDAEMSNDLKARKVVTEDPEAILAEASKQVNEKLNKLDTAENAQKYRTIDKEESKEEKEDKEVEPTSEGDDPNEGEDDEEDLNEEPELNRNLIFAVYDEKPEAVKTALKNGAYYFTRDRHGWTPLHWAASKGNEEIIEILVEHVKKLDKNVLWYINARDTICGWTPLHAACAASQPSAVEVLLRYKARKHKKNNMKEKPWECIGKSHIKELKTLLGVPIPRLVPLPAPAHVEEAKDYADEKATPREDYEPRDAPYGGIPSGRRQPHAPGDDRGHVYDRYSNFSDDSVSKNSYASRPHARDDK